MQGQILVIDPIATNRIVLRVKLGASHYDVAQADSVASAMRQIRLHQPDLILCATHLPDGGPAQLIMRLKRQGLAEKVPVVALGQAPSRTQRLALLSAGVDDILPKPVEDSLLVARVRSLIRAYAQASEWVLRDGTSRALGFAEPKTQFDRRANVRVISCSCKNDWQDVLQSHSNARFGFATPAQAIELQLDEAEPDAFILHCTSCNEVEMLDLLASIRSQPKTRHAAILLVFDEAIPGLAARMLDLGANDVMMDKPDPAELVLRLERQLDRKQVSDALRDTVRTGLEAAVIDPLTGLHNRRYAIPHLARIAERSSASGKPFAVMIADLDHFKRINDTHGHAAGDAVLAETATRLRENLRAVDLIARIGGEEFLIVLPGTALPDAKRAAKRLCRVIRDAAFVTPGARTPITATVSIGLTVHNPAMSQTSTHSLSADGLIDRADRALYDAKSEGRDRVTLGRTAA